MRNSENIDINSFAPSSRTIVLKERYKISDIKSILNVTRGLPIYLPLNPAMVISINNYTITFNSSINTTGWTTNDEIVISVVVKTKNQNLVEQEESYESRLLKIGKPVWFNYLNYPINETAQSLIHRPNAQKIFIPLYIHLHANKDMEIYIRYSESSSNNVTDADASQNPNNAFSNENLLDIVQRKALVPYQMYLKGEIRLQGNTGVSTETGFLKMQTKTMSGQGNGLMNGIVRGIEITQQIF